MAKNKTGASTATARPRKTASSRATARPNARAAVTGKAKRNAKTRPMVTQDQIAQRAYEIWLNKGQPSGLDQENWLEAEQELARAS